MNETQITISQSFNKTVSIPTNSIIKEDLEMSLKINKILPLDSLIRELLRFLSNLTSDSEEDRDYYDFLKKQLLNWEMSDKFIIDDGKA